MALGCYKIPPSLATVSYRTFSLKSLCDKNQTIVTKSIGHHGVALAVCSSLLVGGNSARHSYFWTAEVDSPEHEKSPSVRCNALWHTEWIVNNLLLSTCCCYSSQMNLRKARGSPNSRRKNAGCWMELSLICRGNGWVFLSNRRRTIGKMSEITKRRLFRGYTFFMSILSSKKSKNRRNQHVVMAWYTEY